MNVQVLRDYSKISLIPRSSQLRSQPGRMGGLVGPWRHVAPPPKQADKKSFDFFAHQHKHGSGNECLESNLSNRKVVMGVSNFTTGSGHVAGVASRHAGGSLSRERGAFSEAPRRGARGPDDEIRIARQQPEPFSHPIPQ